MQRWRVSCQHCMQHRRIDDLIILLCSWYNVRCTVCVCGESILFLFYYYDVTPGGMTYQKVSGSWFSRPRLLSCYTLGKIVSLHSSPLINMTHQAGSIFLFYWILQENGLWGIVGGYCVSPRTCSAKSGRSKFGQKSIFLFFWWPNLTKKEVFHQNVLL